MQICYLRPYLGNETDFCRLHVAKDAGKDGNDWNLKKLGHCIFQVLMICLKKYSKKKNNNDNCG